MSCVVNGTTELTSLIKGLKEGKRYKFRVSAKNVYGTSEPLEADSITAKNPFGTLSVLLENNTTLYAEKYSFYCICGIRHAKSVIKVPKCNNDHE